MKKLIFPKIKFTGDTISLLLSNIYSETLEDLYQKYEDGNGDFPKGFLHTSTYKHDGTCYYGQMWSRDCGRGVIELVMNGFTEQAKNVVEYFLSHISSRNCWGREIHSASSENDKELDGNALILLSIYTVWKYAAKEKAKYYSEKVLPVVNYFCDSINHSDTGLIQSISELSGNPCVDYGVYGVVGNYAMLTALSAMQEMFEYAALDTSCLAESIQKLKNAMSLLVSDGVKSKTIKGAWINGLDSRDLTAYDIGEFAGQFCDFSASTRIIPFIFESDYKKFSEFESVHKNSYEFLKSKMAENVLFRKYGFVSNTAWSGMGGRHDDTMAGYGQGYFTQSALYMDDVNCYTKCLEGIARLGYDGNIINTLSSGEVSPFVIHECFNYENYVNSTDHTFGAISHGKENILDNPGDEGNLVQETEILKALRLSVGVYCKGKTLIVEPKLGWLTDGMQLTDYPVFVEDKMVRINLKYTVETCNRRAVLSVLSGCEYFDKIKVRFGPFSLLLRDKKAVNVYNSKWVFVESTSKNQIVYEY